MIESEIRKLLGSDAPDPGCDHSGELMDEYCELVLHGDAFDGVWLVERAARNRRVAS